MSDASTSPATDDEAGKYVAEFVDGPLAGTTEHRFLTDGKAAETITQMGLVEGTDAMFEYVAAESRDVAGEHYVKYSFDQGDSDTLEGNADQDAESRTL